MKNIVKFIFIITSCILFCSTLEAKALEQEYFYGEKRMDESLTIRHLLILNDDNTMLFGDITNRISPFYGTWKQNGFDIEFEIITELGSDVCMYKIKDSMVFKKNQDTITFSKDNEQYELKKVTKNYLLEKEIPIDFDENEKIFCRELMNSLESKGFYRSTNKTELIFKENNQVEFWANEEVMLGKYEIDNQKILLQFNQKIRNKECQNIDKNEIISINFHDDILEFGKSNFNLFLNEATFEATEKNDLTLYQEDAFKNCDLKAEEKEETENTISTKDNTKTYFIIGMCAAIIIIILLIILIFKKKK